MGFIGVTVEKYQQHMERHDINEKGDVPFTVGLDEDNIYKWFLMIEGPEGTIYEGRVF